MSPERSESNAVRLLREAIWRWPFSRGRGLPLRLARALAGERETTFEIGDGCLVTGSIKDYMVGWGFQGFHRRDVGFMRSLAALRPGDTAVDVGANIGLWSLLAAARVGPSGRVIAVEPMPGTMAQLAANVRANGLDNVLLYECALDESAADVEMFGDDVSVGQGLRRKSRRNSGAAGLAPRPGQAEVSVSVKARRLDDFLAASDVGEVSVLKIDVEGAELRVLRGSSDVLRSSAPVVFVEVDPGLMATFGAEPGDVLGLLGDYGYDLFRLDGGRAIGVRPGQAWDHHGDVLALPQRGLPEPFDLVEDGFGRGA